MRVSENVLGSMDWLSWESPRVSRVILLREWVLKIGNNGWRVKYLKLSSWELQLLVINLRFEHWSN